jgi:hypothetical protein
MDTTDYTFLELELEIQFLKKYIELDLKHGHKVSKGHLFTLNQVIEKLNKVKDEVRDEKNSH